MKRLTVKQQKFIDEYLISGNGAQAAIRAGYSEAYADRAIALFGLSMPLGIGLLIALNASQLLGLKRSFN